MDVLTTTLNQMLMFFCVMILGFVLQRRHIVPENADVSISRVLANILAPALVLKTFIANFTLETLIEKSYILLWASVILFVLIFLGTALANFFADNRYVKYLYTYSFIIANIGYLGQPLTQVVFGEEALFNMIIFSIPFYVYIYSVGITRMNPKNQKVSLKSLANPTFYMMGLGMILGILNDKIQIPEFAMSSISSLASCVGVFAMLLTGIVIGKYNLLELVSTGRVYIASILRLVVIPGIFVIVLKWANLPEYIITPTLCSLALPMGLNTVVFPAAYGGDTRPGAAMALISNVLGVITIPLMFQFFKG